MISSRDVSILCDHTDISPYAIVKDHTLDDILDAIHQDVQTLRECLRPAGMGQGDQKWQDNNVRGDSLCWVTTEMCSERKLNGLQAYLNRILTECGIMKEQLGINSAEYNMQFAIYPGKGEGYNRHVDSFSAAGATEASSRQLTCLLYLNKDWEPDDGGQLRIFTKPGVVMDGLEEPFSFWGVHGYDIDPIFGRLVIFRSELVAHAVLPCFHERLALTCWLCGTGPTGGVAKSSTQLVFKFEGAADVDDI